MGGHEEVQEYREPKRGVSGMTERMKDGMKKIVYVGGERHIISLGAYELIRGVLQSDAHSEVSTDYASGGMLSGDDSNSCRVGVDYAKEFDGGESSREECACGAGSEECRADAIRDALDEAVYQRAVNLMEEIATEGYGGETYKLQDDDLTLRVKKRTDGTTKIEILHGSTHRVLSL